jgi:hypothetical protein
MKDGRSVPLTGAQGIDVLRQVDGFDVVVYGPPRRRVDDPIDVQSFSVRGVGGQAARDGILHRAASGDVLELADGRRLAIGRLPSYFVGGDGKRIWISGPAEAPTSVGVIDPDRHDRRPNRSFEVH